MKYNPRFSILVLTALALAQPGFGQPLFLPVFRVGEPNYEITIYRHTEGVAITKDGGIALSWNTPNNPDCLVLRRLDAQVTPPFFSDDLVPIAECPLGSLEGASFARDASGRFVVVWQYDSIYILARRFEADGTPLGDAFQVNAWRPQHANYPSVASDASGNFVVAWIVEGDVGDVLARRFDSAGAPLGDEFLVNQWTPTGYRFWSEVAMSPAGFVVTWAGQGATGTGIFGRLFDSNGTPRTLDFEVDTAATPWLWWGADVAMDASGDFVVVWSSNPSSDTYPVVGRRYGSSGIPDGGVFPISTPADQTLPRVASDSAGNFLVVWGGNIWGGSGAGVAGRSFDAAGEPAGAEFQISAPFDYLMSSFDPRPALAEDGSFVVAWTSMVDYWGGHFDNQVTGRKSGVRASPEIEMDPGSGSSAHAVAHSGNGVLEAGETQFFRTVWVNDTDGAVALTGTAWGFAGPSGADYTLNDAIASYGTIGPGQSASCSDGGDCYSVTVSVPAARPAQHWDARLQEKVSIGVPKTWTLHVGESFADVPADDPFYKSIETLFHHGVTSGCGGADYCPVRTVSRGQMAVFLLKSKFGAAHIPPPCTGAVFTDVSCISPFDPWIEELAALGVTGGCGGGLFCPGSNVTRQQMAVFLLKALEGPAYDAPSCTPDFEDVPCPGQFANWISEIHRRGITDGCSAAPARYCPNGSSNRGQMAVFLTKTFGLALYGG